MPREVDPGSRFVENFVVNSLLGLPVVIIYLIARAYINQEDKTDSGNLDQD